VDQRHKHVCCAKECNRAPEQSGHPANTPQMAKCPVASSCFTCPASAHEINTCWPFVLVLMPPPSIFACTDHHPSTTATRHFLLPLVGLQTHRPSPYSGVSNRNLRSKSARSHGQPKAGADVPCHSVWPESFLNLMPRRVLFQRR
jgi:hypothetical protein